MITYTELEKAPRRLKSLDQEHKPGLGSELQIPGADSATSNGIASGVSEKTIAAVCSMGCRPRDL